MENVARKHRNLFLLILNVKLLNNKTCSNKTTNNNFNKRCHDQLKTIYFDLLEKKQTF